MTESLRIADRQTRFVSVGHALGIILVAFGTGLVVALLVSGVVSAVLPEGDPLVLMSLFAGQFVGFIAVAVGYARYFDRTELLPFRVPTLRELGLAAVGVVGLFAVALVGGYLIQVFGLSQAQNAASQFGREDPVLFLYLIPLQFLLVGPAEEMVFRGIVQGLFKRAYGLVPGLLAASILFGVVHIVALSGSGKATYMAIAAGLGLVLGLVYEYTENLTVPALAHATWNSVLFGSLYVTA